MESGEKSKLVLPLFHKPFRVLPCAEQMGGTRGPHAGSGQTALVGLELSGARCLERLSCPNSTNVDLEYFFKNLKGKVSHSSILAWRFPRLCSPWGRKVSDTTERFSLSMETALGVQTCTAMSPLFSLGGMRHADGLMTL